MKLISDKLGELQYKKDEVITFPEGILGFPERTRYILVEHREGSPFKWLQSLDDPSVSFAVVNPLLVKKDYQIEIRRADLTILKDPDPDHIGVWALVSFSPDAPEKSTVNLLGPLVVNCLTHLGKQLVLDPTRYDLRYPLFQPA